MCLILYAIKVHPRYRLLIAANRDEFYKRPSAPAHFWKDAPILLAGKDLIAGGTWLGITTGGRIASITNFRDPASLRSNARSRGKLATDFLMGHESVDPFIRSLNRSIKDYNGFNLILGDHQKLYYYSSRLKKKQLLSNGLFGLSNNLLDTPWPKVIRGKELLGQVIHEYKEIVPERIVDILQDRTIPEDESLPDTGVGLEMERMLSPIFIKSPDYGTRSTTVILIDNFDRVIFMERTYGPENNSYSDVKFDFQISS